MKRPCSGPWKTRSPMVPVPPPSARTKTAPARRSSPSFGAVRASHMPAIAITRSRTSHQTTTWMPFSGQSRKALQTAPPPRPSVRTIGATVRRSSPLSTAQCISDRERARRVTAAHDTKAQCKIILLYSIRSGYIAGRNSENP